MPLLKPYVDRCEPKPRVYKVYMCDWQRGRKERTDLNYVFSSLYYINSLPDTAKKK